MINKITNVFAVLYILLGVLLLYYPDNVYLKISSDVMIGLSMLFLGKDDNNLGILNSIIEKIKKSK